MNFAKLSIEVLISRETCINWCISKGLFVGERPCPVCGEDLKYYNDRGVAGRFQCRRRNHKHRIAKKASISTAVADNTNYKFCSDLDETNLLVYRKNQKSVVAYAEVCP